MATEFTDLETPDSRVENYLGAMAEQPEANPPESPDSRVEKYLDYFLGNGTAGSVKDVYFLNNHIYKDESMTEEITPVEGRVYYAINSNMLYVYINSAFKTIAGGATNPSKVYNTYQQMVNALNSATKDTLILSSDIYIRTVGVPDLWVSVIETTSVEYTYVSDAQFLSDMATNGYVKVGYFCLSQLESGASLENYYTKAEVNGTFLKIADETVKLLKMNNQAMAYDANTHSYNIPPAIQGSLGVVKTSGDLCIESNHFSAHPGLLSAIVKTKAQFESSAINECAFVSKGTLNNIFTGKNLVDANYVQVTYYEVGSNTAHHAKLYIEEVD